MILHQNKCTNIATLKNIHEDQNGEKVSFSSIIPDVAEKIQFTNMPFPSERTRTFSTPKDETTWVQLGVTINDDIRGWLEGTTFIVSAGIDTIIMANNDSSYMFHDCNITSIEFYNFDTSNVINMQGMFAGCKLLVDLKLNRFNTSNVIDMAGMFSECLNLTKVELKNFDTNKVVNMQSMFYCCCSLVYLDLSNFNTGKVINMMRMFSGCRNLAILNINNFNANNVICMNGMFYGCQNLIKLKHLIHATS